MLPKPQLQETESGCPTEDVVSQLKLILSHELFSNSLVLSNFLKYIVEETLAGNLKSLKEYTIGVNGLGKKVDFNPQIDAIVRIHAGRLRRLLAEYYSGPGQQDRILIEVTKGSYVPVFSQRNLREERPKILSPSLNEIKHVALSKVTVAILPFRNLCQNNEYQFFVDGLGEELTRVFSTSQEFAVIGHHSTLKLSQQHTNLHAIGIKLNAQYIITGTVMHSENHFRVNVGLVETEMSIQIWSKVYDYDSDIDFLQVQDQTIENVYALLGGEFGFTVRHRALTKKSSTEDPIEFDAALWNYQFHTNFSFFNYAKTRKVLEIVLQNDPHFLMALAMLSELYLWGHILGYPTAEDPVPASLQLAQKAMTVDPQSRQACLSFLWASLYTKGYAGIEHELEHILDQRPSPELEGSKLGMVLVCGGDYDRAKVLLEQSIKPNAHYPWSSDLALCLIHFRNNQYADALEIINRIGATDIYLVDLMKMILLNKSGLPQEAKPYLASLTENYSFITLNLKAQLSNFLLDDSLIDKILQAAREAGAVTE